MTRLKKYRVNTPFCSKITVRNLESSNSPINEEKFLPEKCCERLDSFPATQFRRKSV